MNYNFLRVGAANIVTKVGNTAHNTEQIINKLTLANDKNVNVVVFPELCLSGYTCGDLFTQSILLSECKKSLIRLADFSKQIDTHFIVGAPLVYNSNLYNVAFFIGDGKIIGAVPKINIPNYNEFYEKRWFNSGKKLNATITIGKSTFLLSPNQVFSHNSYENFDFGIEICEDVWVMEPPSTNLAKNGAKIIFNLSASNDITGKNSYRRSLISNQSARTFTSYVYSSAGFGESTTDLVFGGKLIIAENGSILNENQRFSIDSELIFSDIDLEKLNNERIKHISLFEASNEYIITKFKSKINEIDIKLQLPKSPFIPRDTIKMNERCEEVINIQAMGLVKRLSHINCKKAVIGISGGLDSTLTLIVTYRAFEILNLDLKGIIAITMPGFGTTGRTYDNAVKLIKKLNLTFKEISIKDATLMHFGDIGHNANNKNVVYENAQARERTKILMDIANMESAIVIGTGDLSELALGFATYNGDHMSMYSVNSSVPKTLVKHLIKWASTQPQFKEVKQILIDVYDTPVSPELLPPDESGKIAQKTESIVGPYELHDFFLYHLIRNGFSPDKILFLATKTFDGDYDKQTIEKWLTIFMRRFFTSQFKRSCMPDGPKVGSVCLSPRGDWRMPSDMDNSIWLK